jgi:hypothetical protein
MKRALFCLVIPAALVALSPATLAGKLNFNYIEVGYNDVDINNLNNMVNGDGDGVFGSVAIGFGGQWHFLGRYDNNETDSNVELTQWMAVGGWHGAMGERAAFVSELFYLEMETESAKGATLFKDDGYGVRAGTRMGFKYLEVGVFYRWQDMDVIGSDSGFEANVIVNFWRIGVGIGYENVTAVETYSAFARLNFGKR